MKTRSFLKTLTVLMPIALVTACGGSDDNAKTPASAMPEAQLITLDARRQDIYDTNCVVCHGMAGSGAPQTGVIDDWRERSGKGMEVMLDNVMDGFQAMPAMGGCFDCDEDDFRLLTTFMTSGMLK
jgi:cytochrome c5